MVGWYCGGGGIMAQSDCAVVHFDNERNKNVFGLLRGEFALLGRVVLLYGQLHGWILVKDKENTTGEYWILYCWRKVLSEEYLHTWNHTKRDVNGLVAVLVWGQNSFRKLFLWQNHNSYQKCKISLSSPQFSSATVLTRVPFLPPTMQNFFLWDQTQTRSLEPVTKVKFITPWFN